MEGARAARLKNDQKEHDKGWRQIVPKKIREISKPILAKAFAHPYFASFFLLFLYVCFFVIKNTAKARENQ